MSPEVDDAAAERIARNNSAFREANDGIEIAATEHSIDRGAHVPFICECSDRHCVAIIRLTLEEYAHVRSNPSWFANAVSHEEQLEGVVAPVARNSRYVIVEKINHAGVIATELATDETRG